ncbi:GntR family transcriptional regulator, partial [Pacificibacter sp.]|uniref:GntR family transcriptional regulator n=1 Tax=Pacificibacter sp. TaxID=1917866 RepID=UPI00321B58BF
MASDSKSKLGSLNTPIVRQKLSDQVFDRLWDMIQTGELSAGDFMPSERVLMEKFGVGRPAVREALQMMANKGLISISHGERSKVNKL